ncbi:MAG: glucosyltransferase domain-containing protein, partial [Pseudomonadota bacterium]
MRDKGATDPTPETGLRESLRRAFEPHLGVFALLFALAWIAYGVHAAGLLFSIDDWEFTLGEPGAVERMIAFGRWVQALSIRYVAGETLAPAVSLFLMLALQGAALALFLETTVQREGTTVFLVLALVLFHPLGIESVQVEQNHVAAGIALGANILAGTLAWRVAREGSGIALSRAAPILLGASALLMLGAAAFQQFAALTPMAFLLAWALDSKPSGYGPLAAVRRLAVIGGVSIVGVALYYASAFVAKAIAGIGAEAASYYYDITSGFAADAGTLAIKRRDVPVMIQQVYFGPQHLIGMGEKLAILALLVLALAGGLRRALAAPSGLPRLIDGGVLLGTLGVMMLLPFVLPTIR